MLINQQGLDLVFKGFQSVYTDAFLKAEVDWDKIAMQVTSAGRDETYGWLGQFPQLREWLGPRHVHGLTAHSFTIQNLDFESTVSVARNDIMDDRLGVFKPAFSEMGYLARHHPEELVMGLLSKGFSTTCYDGQNYFDEEHPVKIEHSANATQAVSNMQTGTGPGWYLLDLSRQVRPIVFQERKPYDFVAMIEPNNPHVFMNKEYIYGVEGSRALRSARYIAHKSTAWKAVDCSCDASRRSFRERYRANTSQHRRHSAQLVESTKRATGWDR